MVAVDVAQEALERWFVAGDLAEVVDCARVLSRSR